MKGNVKKQVSCFFNVCISQAKNNRGCHDDDAFWHHKLVLSLFKWTNDLLSAKHVYILFLAIINL